MPSRSRNETLKPSAIKGQTSVFRRERAALGFGWHRLDPALMFAAFQQCLLGGHALMLSQAAAGRGVCIRIMKGRTETPEVEYAMDAEELSEWFEAIIQAYQLPSEDALLSMRAALGDEAARRSTPVRVLSAKNKERAEASAD